MPNLTQIAAQLQDLAKALEVIDKQKPSEPDEYTKDLNDLFPRVGLAGAVRERHTASLEGLPEEQIVEFEVEVAPEDDTTFSVSLGGAGSNLGVTMALTNGYRVRLVDLEGETITGWGHRAEGRTADLVTTNFWGGKGVLKAEANVSPGETVLLQVKAGSWMNATGRITLTYLSSGPKG